MKICHNCGKKCAGYRRSPEDKPCCYYCWHKLYFTCGKCEKLKISKGRHISKDWREYDMCNECWLKHTRGYKYRYIKAR
jgi:hypothetical protein